MRQRSRLNDEDVRYAFRRMCMIPEAVAFVDALQSIVEEIGPEETCALQRHNARRTLARELLAMAATEVTDSESERRLEPTNRYAADPPITLRKNRRKGPR